MSTMTCLLYLIPGFLYNANLLMTFWDLFLFVLWITVFGLFGKVCSPDLSQLLLFSLLTGPVALHQQGRRGRSRHSAHEGRSLGRLGQRADLALPGHRHCLLLAQEPQP